MYLSVLKYKYQSASLQAWKQDKFYCIACFITTLIELIVFLNFLMEHS